MFIRFDRIHERDRQTNGWTDRHLMSHDGIDRACIASRGKKLNKIHCCVAVCAINGHATCDLLSPSIAWRSESLNILVSLNITQSFEFTKLNIGRA